MPGPAGPLRPWAITRGVCLSGRGRELGQQAPQSTLGLALEKQKNFVFLPGSTGASALWARGEVLVTFPFLDRESLLVAANSTDDSSRGCRLPRAVSGHSPHLSGGGAPPAARHGAARHTAVATAGCTVGKRRGRDRLAGVKVVVAGDVDAQA